MERFIHDKTNGLDYELVGDYYIPLLTMPKSPKLCAFGKAYFRYLRAEKKTLFTVMELNGMLNAHLEEVDREAKEMFSLLVKELSENEGVTEQLKSDNQMLWVQKMCNIRNRATEIVNAELIYV